MLSYIPTASAKRAKAKKKKAPNFSCAACALSKNFDTTPVYTRDKLIPFNQIRERDNEKIVVILFPYPDTDDMLMSYKAREILGKLTKEHLPHADKIYMFPIIKCPHSKDPTKKMVQCCMSFLRKELVDADPDVIICLGKASTIPFGLEGKATEVYSRIYNVAPIKLGEKSTREARLIATHSPDKFVDDYKLLTSVESAFKQADRQLTDGTEESPSNYYLIETPEEFEAFVNAHINDERLSKLTHAFDIETNGRRIHPRDQFEADHPPKIRCISFSWDSGCAVCVPLERDMEHFMPVLKRFMTSNVNFIGHNVAFDYFFLRLVNGITTKNIVGDTMLMASLLVPGLGKYGYSLKRLSAENTSLSGYETDMKSTEDEKDSEGRIIQTKWEIADMDTMAPYNCADSDATLRLYKQFIHEIRENNMLPAHWIMTNAFIPLGEMEHNGFYIDRQWVDESRTIVEGLVNQYQEELKRLCNGHEYDWNSPQVVGHVLYNLLGYKVPIVEESYGSKDENDKGKLPTGDVALSMLNTPFTQTLRKYRRASKLLSTYFNGYLVRTGMDNRFRTEFNLVGTITGRLSSSGESGNL